MCKCIWADWRAVLLWHMHMPRHRQAVLAGQSGRLFHPAWCGVVLVCVHMDAPCTCHVCTQGYGLVRGMMYAPHVCIMPVFVAVGALAGYVSVCEYAVGTCRRDGVRMLRNLLWRQRGGLFSPPIL